MFLMFADIIKQIVCLGCGSGAPRLISASPSSIDRAMSNSPIIYQFFFIFYRKKIINKGNFPQLLPTMRKFLQGLWCMEGCESPEKVGGE